MTRPIVRTLLDWTDATGASGALEIDCTKSRGFELAAEVTEFPVESGSAIADNIRPVNGTVAIEGTISNSPIDLPSTQMEGVTQVTGSQTLSGGSRATMTTFSGPFDRRRACDTVLAALVSSGTPVRLTTSLRTVENLAITRYKVDESVETGDALPLVMEFKALRIATTARVPVPAVRRLQVPPNRAVQPTDDRSVAARALDNGRPADAARQRARAALAARGGGVGL